MAQKNFYKPRNTIAYITKSKVWPTKNAYLRRMYTIRGRRLRREQGLFRRCVLVATTIKWTSARRFMRPLRQSVRSRTISSTNKKAFGRPFKRRYRNIFYIKQQLRLFHGEVKESVFRNLFRNHLNTVTTRSNSFFSALESRLDRFFFRRRLLPTIFACRQFIEHQGLEVNSQIEKSPRAQIRTGDIVVVPEIAWDSLYWELLIRIYFRRWGLYIRRRRLFKQRKKRLFFARRGSDIKKKILNTFMQIVNAQTESSNFHSGVISKKITFSRLNKPIPADTLDSSFDKSSVHQLVTQLFKLSPSTGTALQRLAAYNQSFFNRHLAISKEVQSKAILSNMDFFSAQRQPYPSRLNSFVRRTFDRSDNNSCLSKRSTFRGKCIHYQKLAFSLRFRKLALPSYFQYATKRTKVISRSKCKRTKLLRFYFKKAKKTVQNQKRIRLKGIHYFIPSYIQIDYRTLRAVKVQSSSQEDIYYPFRISLSKRYSFYRSRGY